jgi:hypothetical protein
VPKAASISAMCQISMAPVKMSAASRPWRPKRDQVGGHHDEVARQPVRPHAADQQEADERHRVAREHDADVARRADVGHVQRQRHDHQPVANRAQALPVEQEPEVAMAEQAAHHPP